MRLDGNRFAPLWVLLALPGVCPAAEAPAADKPAVVAPTRPELKAQLERSKQSNPRLPLPAATERDAAEARARFEEAKAKGRAAGSGLGGGVVNNGRMRKLYLTEVTGGAAAGFSREPDPALTLSPTLKTMFFWIVSRANNCTYCQGHQESKLAADGVTEDRIAALDGDWSAYTPAEQAAFAFTLKLTREPQNVGARDVDALRAYYNDRQILEIVVTVAGNNAMNRWTGSLAIPQEAHRVYLTPTSEKYRALRSLVAPLDLKAEGPACAPPADRGTLESREQVEAALAAARRRPARLPLAGDDQARAVLPEGRPDASAALPAWVRLLANFPKAGKGWVAQVYNAQDKGTLSPKLRAEVAWVAARNDRAWYALGHARKRLHALGLDDGAVFALDRPAESSDPAERAALAFTRKLTVDPALMTDGDFAALRAHYSNQEVAELVYQVTQAAYFDRLTEASGLPLEE
jgi:alkylhydroperoxidase family enzyme